MCEVQVTHKYNAANPDELTLMPGDVLTECFPLDGEPGWMVGVLRGKSGLFPDNFVVKISKEKDGKANAVVPDTHGNEYDMAVGAPTGEISKIIGRHVDVVEDFEAIKSGQMKLRKGDKVKVVRSHDAEWLYGECKNAKGLFPAANVKLSVADATKARPQSKGKVDKPPPSSKSASLGGGNFQTSTKESHLPNSVHSKIRYFEENPFIFPVVSPSLLTKQSIQSLRAGSGSIRKPLAATFAHSNHQNPENPVEQLESQNIVKKSSQDLQGFGLISLLGKLKDKELPLSDQLNMDSSRRTLMSTSAEVLEKHKRVLLDLCQGCRSIAVAQEAYDEFMKVRRYRSSIDACLDLSQSFATDLIEASLSSGQPIVSRFCLNHICPVVSTPETVPVIDNEFISSPCCFTALYKLSDWKRKLIPALDLDTAHAKVYSKPKPSKDELENFEPMQPMKRKEDLKHREKTKRAVSKSARKESKQHEFLLVSHQKNYSTSSNEFESPKRKLVRVSNSQNGKKSSITVDSWPWEDVENSYEGTRKLKEVELLRRIWKDSVGVDSRHSAVTPPPKKNDRTVTLKQFANSESKVMFNSKNTRKSARSKDLRKYYDTSGVKHWDEKTLNYSLDASEISGRLETQNRRKDRRVTSKGNDKWPWEDERSLNEYLNDTYTQLQRDCDTTISEWSISPIAKKRSPEVQQSGQESDVPSRPVSSRATVRSVPCRALGVQNSLQTAYLPTYSPTGVERENKPRLCNSDEAHSRVSVNDFGGADRSLSDAERFSDERDPRSKKYTRNKSQHCVEFASRQPSFDRSEIIQDIIQASPVTKTSQTGNSKPGCANVLYVQAEVHPEPMDLFNNLFFPKQSTEELLEEFYDLPSSFQKNTDVSSIESLCSQVLRVKKGGSISSKENLKLATLLKGKKDDSSVDRFLGFSTDEPGLSENLDETFTSEASFVAKDCFNSALFKNSFRKAAKSIFKKSDSSNEDSSQHKKETISRYLSFLNQRDGYHSDPESLRVPWEYPLKLLPSEPDVLSEMGHKTTQTEFDNTSSGVQCDGSADSYCDENNLDNTNKETQTDFSILDTCNTWSEDESSSLMNRSFVSVDSSVKSGCYNLQNRKLSSSCNRRNSTDFYLTNNTFPFSDPSYELEKCFLYAEDHFRSHYCKDQNELRRNLVDADQYDIPQRVLDNFECLIKRSEQGSPDLPDLTHHLNAIEDEVTAAVESFSTFNEALESCHKIIRQLPGGSTVSSELSINNSRLSMVKCEDLSGTLKRGNFKLSPLTSPLRKKDKGKIDNVQLRSPVSSSERNISMKFSDDLYDEESISALKHSVIKELQRYNSLNQRQEGAAETNDALNSDSDVSILAPLAACDSILTVNSARLSRNFERESFLQENRKSSRSSTKRSSIYTSPSVSEDTDFKSSSNIDTCLKTFGGSSDLEQTRDYDEQYKEISDSYQNLAFQLSQRRSSGMYTESSTDSSLLNEGMIKNDDDSLNVYSIDPISANKTYPDDSIIHFHTIDDTSRLNASIGDQSCSKMLMNQSESRSQPDQSDFRSADNESAFNTAFNVLDEDTSGLESSLTFGSPLSHLEKENKFTVNEYNSPKVQVGKCDNELRSDMKNSKDSVLSKVTNDSRFLGKQRLEQNREDDDASWDLHDESPAGQNGEQETVEVSEELVVARSKAHCRLQ